MPDPWNLHSSFQDARERSRSPRGYSYGCSYGSQDGRDRSRSPRGYSYGSEGYGGIPDSAQTIHVAGVTDQRFEGKLLSVHPEKGFGFIECPPRLRNQFKNKDIFIHKTSMSNFRVGDHVSFGVILYKDGKPQAKDLRAVRSSGPPATSSSAGAGLDQGLASLISALAPVLQGSAGTRAPQAEPNPIASLASVLAPLLQGAAQHAQGNRQPQSGHSDYSYEDAGEDTSYELEVPYELVGALVGKQGMTIHELERKAGGGVHIQVHRPDYEGGPQIAQVRGPARRADHAIGLVKQKLEEIRQSRIAHDMIRSGQRPEEVPPSQRPDQIHELEVPADLIGALVGKQGSVIHELEKKGGGGVHIQVHQPQVVGGSQMVQITGPREGADRCYAFVQEKLEEIQDQRAAHDQGLAPSPLDMQDEPTTTGLAEGEVPPAPEDIMHEVEVPPDLVGALIGKQGSCIHELEKRAGGGVHIQIPPAELPGGPQNAQITGPALEASLGKLLVQQKIEELRAERIAHQKHPPLRTISTPSTPASSSNSAGSVPPPGSLAATAQAIASNGPGDAAQTVEVQPDLVGALIGKQGACINELQEKAGGVHIEINPPHYPGGSQAAIITGPAVQVAVGVVLVRQKLEELRRERAAHEHLRSGPSSSNPLPSYTQPAAAAAATGSHRGLPPSRQLAAPEPRNAGGAGGGLTSQALIQAAAAVLSLAFQPGALK